MNSSPRFAVLAIGASALIALTGCASHPRYYAAPPPPPPAYGPSPLVQLADSNGFHDGQSDGARDLIQRQSYRPRWDRRYAATPGYDGRMGPYPVYRDNYRLAYLRGYNVGFRRAEGGQ
jgi:hypothetical protein